MSYMRIRELEDKVSFLEKRIEEIARIIGGVSVTDLTLENAEETLRLAKEYKKGIS